MSFHSLTYIFVNKKNKRIHDIFISLETTKKSPQKKKISRMMDIRWE